MMISSTELKLRWHKIRALMTESQTEAALFTCNVNLLYSCGHIFSGYFYLPVNGEPWYFVRRPNNLTGPNVAYIRKPEQILEILKEKGVELPKALLLEADELPYSDYIRLENLFSFANCSNGSAIIRKARSIKTPFEIELFRQSGIAHSRAYRNIPGVYRPGMDDLHLSIEIERLMRLEGNLGIFRIYGQSMETFMGSLLAGDNAETPSPYDFALGGGGMDVALPISVNGTRLNKGMTVMVDLGGNFNGYMGDMSRVFSIGKTTEEAYRAHQVCLEIQDQVSGMAKPGAVCEELYDKAVGIATRAGFGDRFMGSKQKAKFIGHGIGLEINEAPVLAPRIKQELEPGMVFALEPKIVLPGTGPVGIENSWAVNENGVEKLTICPEEIIELK